MTNMEILGLLEKGDISVRRSLSLLKSRNKRKTLVRKNRWLKIQIKDEKHNFKLYVPLSLLSFGLSIAKLLMANTNKYVKDNAEIQGRQILANIDNKYIKKFIKILKHSGKINIIEVRDGKNLVIVSIV